MTWEESDAVKLRDYIQKSGNRIRLYLRTRIPRVSGKTIEEVALNAQYKEGFELALKEIDDMVVASELASDPSSGNFTTM